MTQQLQNLGQILKKEKATRILMERGANSRLIMHLTGLCCNAKHFLNDMLFFK
jgi:hypothetical protein